MKPKMRLHFAILLFLFSLGLVGIAGCNLIDQSNPLEPTLTALNVSIAQTMTADNRLDIMEQSQATAESAATAQSQVLVTQTAESIVQEQLQQATATIAAPVMAELPQYGLEPTSGQLGWLHDPLQLQLSGYHEFKYGNDHMNVTAADFVLASDIYWDTQFGGSGCGFMFRSNGDQNNPDQYMVLATRFASGHIVFLALKDGEIANFRDFYPRTDDKSFSIDNGTTNRLAVVARGNMIEIYTNGVKIGTVDTTQAPKRPMLPTAPKPPDDLKDVPALQRYQKLKLEYDEVVGTINSNFQKAMKNYQDGQAIYTDGFLGMVALSESGQTICNFEDAWLWLLNE